VEALRASFLGTMAVVFNSNQILFAVVRDEEMVAEAVVSGDIEQNKVGQVNGRVARDSFVAGVAEWEHVERGCLVASVDTLVSHKRLHVCELLATRQQLLSVRFSPDDRLS